MAGNVSLIDTLAHHDEVTILGNTNTTMGITRDSLSDRESPGEVPRELLFSTDSLVSIVTYSVLFVIAAIGNLSVFLTLFSTRCRRGVSRVSVFIMHLTMADLIVTFVMLPMEIGWHATVAWKAGDKACRILMFFRTFGFYLSSLILIAISLDRYFAVTHPLSLTHAGKRARIMICLAWVLGVIASAPQSVIFHVEHHPMYPWFTQCVTFNFFPTETHELAYNLFNIFMLYLIPLIVIVLCYSLILREMSRRSRLNNSGGLPINTFPRRLNSTEVDVLRCSSNGRLDKARMHTLKMTIVIVAVFIVCWTPYFLILVLWWTDKETAAKIDPKIQRGLFIFAVSNSCMNPVVYGMFTTVFRRELKRKCRTLLPCVCGKRKKAKFRQNQFELYYYQNRLRPNRTNS